MIKNPNDNLNDKLENLAKDQSGKSKIVIFRQHFDNIEKAIKSGVSQHKIVTVLNENDIEISYALFVKYLYRERKRRNLSKEKTSESFTAPSTLESFRMSEVVPKNSAISSPDKEKTESESEPTKEWKSSYSKNDPRMIDEILRNSTDIDALAKEYRELKKKGKQ